MAADNSPVVLCLSMIRGLGSDSTRYNVDDTSRTTTHQVVFNDTHISQCSFDVRYSMDLIPQVTTEDRKSLPYLCAPVEYQSNPIEGLQFFDRLLQSFPTMLLTMAMMTIRPRVKTPSRSSLDSVWRDLKSISLFYAARFAAYSGQ